MARRQPGSPSRAGREEDSDGDAAPRSSQGGMFHLSKRYARLSMDESPPPYAGNAAAERLHPLSPSPSSPTPNLSPEQIARKRYALAEQIQRQKEYLAQKYGTATRSGEDDDDHSDDDDADDDEEEEGAADDNNDNDDNDDNDEDDVAPDYWNTTHAPHAVHYHVPATGKGAKAGDEVIQGSLEAWTANAAVPVMDISSFLGSDGETEEPKPVNLSDFFSGAS